MTLVPPAFPVPSPTEVLKHLGNEVYDSIQFFEKLNGPFPFDHLDISQIPGSFGQGWPELVYLSTLAFLPSEAETRAGIAEITQEEARELMPFHEVAHQWWGNVVVSASYRDAWIEEGMANYLSILYSDSKKSNGRRLLTWLEQFRDQLTAKPPGTTETVAEAGPLSLGFRLASSKTPRAYETIVYGKGTWVIHMLHEMMREPLAKDPDARFRDLLHSVLVEYRFHAFSTEDFERAIEKRMTPAMDLDGTHRIDWFFAQWVRETGIPHYKIAFQVKPRGQQFVVTGKLLQGQVEDEFTAAIPIYGARAIGKPERLGVVVATGPETRFRFVTGMRPTRLLIDPHLTVLCRTD
jgi:aminopeptidase N